ncbi:MAG: right-handed parallel beta-helix repeat-containing protein [Mucilaginibacter polytrichastri]|nr:right-handed parallel beta-helix repeat-containing protein [Mucilaginibacter polytrichastri]
MHIFYLSTGFTLRRFFVLFLVAFSANAYGKTYYLSSSGGDDSRSAELAQRAETPWKTINRLNEFTGLQPGDSVLFKRDEIFFGSLDIRVRGAAGRPVVYASYGAGERPVITSLKSITRWRQAGKGIYESPIDISGQSVNTVLINKSAYAVGRFPNSNSSNGGYLKVASHTGKSAITSPEIPTGSNFTGAEVVIRKNHWIIDRHKISMHSGTVIHYDNNNSVYEATDQFGFFIQRHISTLDQFGEWFYDDDKKKLTVFFGNTDPQDTHVSIAVYKNLIRTPQSSGVDMYLEFKGITLRGSNESAILFNSGNHFIVKDCRIEFAGKNGIESNGTAYLTVTDCSILKSANNGITSVWDNANTVIESNKIDSTSMYPGMLQSGDGNGLAIFCIGKNSRIRKNTITNTGYTGIHFGGDGVQVLNNLIDGFCMVKDDGSGIYTYTGAENRVFTGRVIANNIVLNGRGAISGSENSYPATEGIYLDDNATNVTVTGNTVAHIAGSGLYIHNARNLKIDHNLIYDANVQMRLNHDGLGEQISGLSISGNTFFARSAGQNLLKISTIKDDVNNMARLDSNIYARPLNNSGAYVQVSHNTSAGAVSSDYDLENWKRVSSQDQSSLQCNLEIPEFKILGATGLNQISNGSFDQSIRGIEAWSPANRVKLSRTDNGALGVEADGLAYVMVSVGTVDPSKTYVLKLNHLAKKTGIVNVYLRQHQAPYKILSEVKSYTTSSKKGETQMVFKVSTAEPDCVLVFETKNPDMIYSLDNLQFTESAVAMTEPDDYIRFEYNASKTEKIISLNGFYITPANSVLTGNQKIQSFNSGIFIWNDQLPATTPPVVDCDDKRNRIYVSHPLGPSEILMSENDGPFRQYTGAIDVGNLERARGFWKFKIKQTHERMESAIVESDPFTVSSATEPGVRIYPNPVSTVANFYISNPESGNCIISLYNLRGNKVTEQRFEKTGNDLIAIMPVNYLNSGIYFVTIQINGQSFACRMFKL